MESSKYNIRFHKLIAQAADICRKPWFHSVVSFNPNEDVYSNNYLDITIRIECRDKEGQRFAEYDIDLELYKSGEELSLILAWSNQPHKPILWQGKHSIWMNGDNGKKCEAPLDKDSISLESLSRRLRAIFISLI